MSKAKEQADIRREEAKRILGLALDVGVSRAVLGQAVDCIIAAAILEMSAIQQAAARND